MTEARLTTRIHLGITSDTLARVDALVQADRERGLETDRQVKLRALIKSALDETERKRSR